VSPALKKWLSVAVSLAILAVIYRRVDLGAMAAVFRASHPGWLAVSLAMVVPLTLLTAHRLQFLAPAEARLTLGQALSLTLAASVLNMILPSKMGDVAKSYFIAERGHVSGALAVALVVFEKGWDMLSLLAWCAFGLLFLSTADPLFWVLAAAIVGGTVLMLLVLGSARFAALAFRVAGAAVPAKGRAKGRAKLAALRGGWEEMQRRARQAPARAAYVALVSLVLWFLHLLQIWLFIVALRASAPLVATLGLAPLAILAGLLPLTFAGVGTRDAALIFFFRGYFGPATGAALGLLATMRYVMPALAGLPVFHRYLIVRREPAERPAPSAERRIRKLSVVD
jgi:glycosyltransferase 2 family protein